MTIGIIENSIYRVKDEPSSPTLILEEFEIDKSQIGSMNSSFPLSSTAIIVKNEVNSESSPKVKEEFEAGLNSSEFDKELIQREKNFINVFIDGDYSKLDNPLPIEISNQFFKDIQLKSFQVEYLKERLSSHFKLVDLKALPRFKNQLEELTNLYSIPIEDVEFKFDWKLQVNSCQSFEKAIPRCSHCVFKQTDVCRFKGIRILAIDSKTSRVILTPPQWQHYSKYVTSYPLITAQRKNREKIGKKYKEINEELELYEELNENVPIIECEESQPLEDFQKVNYQKYIIANTGSSLKSFLTLQLDLFKYSKVYLKKCISRGQHQCDQCMATLLNIYFLGKHCGIELCYECYLVADISNLKSNCVKRSKHAMSDFIPVTIYPKEIFEWLLEKSEEIICASPITYTELPNSMFVYDGSDINVDKSKRIYKPYLRGTEKQLKLEGYQSAMQNGIPFVVEDVTKHHYNDFSAKKLSKYYGSIIIEKLQGNESTPKKTTLSEFFKRFTDREEKWPITRPRKIKDSSPFSNIKTFSPSMYNTFLNSLPFKECTHPDGLLNLTSYLPNHFNPPDLGPMTFVETGRKFNDSRGTTQLKLDVSDSLYIMTHSYKSGYELPNIKCAALWHIFDYKDTDKIRDYLKNWNESRKSKTHDKVYDYIHDQNMYLTSKMLTKLKEQQGVAAYQIYQNVGDCIFIPAGCAYQVLNLSNCIQVSTGYISPERTYQCMQLASEFRKLPNKHYQNNDLAQVQNHIVFSNSQCISILENIDNKLLDSIESPPKPKRSRITRQTTPEYDCNRYSFRKRTKT